MMHQEWKDRGNIKCTEQLLCDQKKQIEDKTLLTLAEIEEMKQQVKVTLSKRKMTNNLKKNNRQQLPSWNLYNLKSTLKQKTQYHQHIMKHQMMMMIMIMNMTS